MFVNNSRKQNHRNLQTYSISQYLQTSRITFLQNKQTFCISENKDADQLCSNYCDSIILLLQNPKFQASSCLLWLYSLLCVGSGRKPQHWVSNVAAQIRFECNLILPTFSVISSMLGIPTPDSVSTCNIELICMRISRCFLSRLSSLAWASSFSSNCFLEEY